MLLEPTGASQLLVFFENSALLRVPHLGRAGLTEVFMFSTPRLASSESTAAAYHNASAYLVRVSLPSFVIYVIFVHIVKILAPDEWLAYTWSLVNSM